MRTATRGLYPGEGLRRGLRRRSMMAKMPTMISRALIRMSPTKKMKTMNLATKAALENAIESGTARRYCHSVSCGMTSEVVLPINWGAGGDGVAVLAKGVNETRESGNRRRAIAPAVVKQNDRATKLRFGLHIVELAEDRLGDFCWRLPGMFVPVVGVQLVADDRVAVLLNLDNGCGLIVGVGLFVDVIGRAEVERLDSGLAGKQDVGELNLEIQLARRDIADVRMRVGVVANLVAFAINALHDPNIFGSFGADQHEGAFHAFLLQNVEDLRSPLGVGAIVERSQIGRA